MQIQDHLDQLLNDAPGCSLATFGDLSSGLILKWSAPSPCPREVLDQLSLPNHDLRLADQAILRGGPVQTDRGFVLHRPTGREWDSTLEVSGTLHVTTSRDVLESLAHGDGPSEAAMALGYAGWEAGQLEEEMLHNSWLTAPCDDSIVFEVPFEQRWHAAARLLGVDLSRISHVSGHA